MGKASVGRPVSLLIVLSALTLGTSGASAQNQSFDHPQKRGCAAPTAEISNIQRPTGVLRADPNANDTASRQIANDVASACQNFSTPTAASQARLKISDNNIIVSGSVPTAADEQQLLYIIGERADGRTVFNRLEITRSEIPPTLKPIRLRR